MIKEMRTCDDRLIMSLRNQGTQVRDNIDKAARNASNVTNLADKIISIWNCNNQIYLLVIYEETKVRSCD